MKIIETCNFDSDYPNEKFLNLPNMTEAHANEVAKAINNGFNSENYTHPRFWRAVENDYKLAPGFQP